MKKSLLLLLALSLFSFTKEKAEKRLHLSGYLLTYSFRPKHDCPCGLDIPSTDCLASDTFAKEVCICDGNFYKNFGILRFVKADELDLSKIDVFSYQTKLGNSGKEHLAFLSTNKNILRDVYGRDSTLMNDTSLIRQVQSDTVLAELIYKAIA